MGSVLLTAISDVEVLNEEHDGSYNLRYPIENSEDYLIVATTRPETMLGDKVAVHPDDERYQHFMVSIVLPLTAYRYCR